MVAKPEKSQASKNYQTRLRTTSQAKLVAATPL
jgi:hypothetical protein